MFVYPSSRILFAYGILLVSFSGGCNDSVKSRKPAAKTIDQTVKKDSVAFSHAHCHPKALGPSHVADAEADRFRSRGTREMAERLKFIDLATDPENNEFASDRRVELLATAQKTRVIQEMLLEIRLHWKKNKR